MSVALKRHAKVEDVTRKAAGALDEQGRTAFGAGQTIKARVVRVDDVARLPSGEEIKTQVTLWIDSAQSPLPAIDDRIELTDGSGFAGIVVERSEPKGIQDGAKDHVEIKLREV